MIARPDHVGEIEYFRRRAIEEQVAAANAVGEEARKRHDEFAMMYRFKVEMLSTGPDSWAEALVGDSQPDMA